MKKYIYTGNSSFENAYHDCKIVDESIYNEKSYQEADCGLVLYYMDRILEALEKQIPKKPDLEGDGYADGHLVYDTWFCPCCNKDYEVDYDDYDYCPNCGQAIDWSKEE